MKLFIIAIGQRLPEWAQIGYGDYSRRLPAELKLELRALKSEKRGSRALAAVLAAERARIEAALPRGAHVVALDERGERLDTLALAQRLNRWQRDAQDVALLIGGPDGLDPALRAQAHERIRLSDLTLPHALLRVLLIEQIYRAWSINCGHPYHRE